MKINLKLVVEIMLVIAMGFSNTYFLFKIFYPNPNVLTRVRNQETTTINSLKNLKKAVETLKEKESLKEEKTMTTTAPSEKEKLKVEILNGSGVTGRANTIKDNLTEINLEITTGNTEATASTTIKFKETVSPEIKKEIMDKITEEFSNPKEEILPVDNPSDMIIILGKPK